MACVYHAPSPSDEPPNLLRSTDHKLEEMKSQHKPAREEHFWSVHTILRCTNNPKKHVWLKRRWRTTTNTLEGCVTCIE
jgi:hypothetical protein